MKLSIIIPVFNEESTISELLSRVFAVDTGVWDKQVIVVDDASGDNSAKVIEALKNKYNFIFLKHEKNLGKGAGIRTGLGEARGDAVLVQDADLEYNPVDYTKLLTAFAPGVDAVFGSRMMHGTQGGYWHYVLGASLLNLAINLMYGSKLTDVYTGYKLIKRDVFLGLNISSNGFEMESEIVCKLLKYKRKIVEVPVSYKPRSFRKGKKIRPKDALKGLYTALEIRY